MLHILSPVIKVWLQVKGQLLQVLSYIYFTIDIYKLKE